MTSVLQVQCYTEMFVNAFYAVLFHTSTFCIAICSVPIARSVFVSFI